MADNIQVSTAAVGTVMATDEISAVHWPGIKVAWGADGSVAYASATDPLPVAVTGIVKVSGVVGAVSGVVHISGTAAVLQTAAMSGVVSVSGVVDTSGSTVKVSGVVGAVSGIVSVSGTVAVNQTAAVSGVVSVSGTVAATQSGAWTVVADAGTNLNTSLLATEATLAGAIKAEDAVHSSGDKGVMALAVRSDAGSAFAADGDYVPLSIDSAGALRVTGGGGGTQYTEGDTDASITGTAILWEDSGNTLSPISTSAPLPTQILAGVVDIGSVTPLTGATNLGKAEDAAHTSGDVGVMALAVRSDAGSAFGADGDYVPLSIDSAGALRVTGGGGGTQYTEGDTDASITGSAILWEDTSDTLRAVSAAKPLPVGVIGAVSGVVSVSGTVAVNQTVAMSGVVSVSGTVAATQSGSWTVSEVTSAVTWQAEGSILASSLTTGYLTVFTTAGSLVWVGMRNNTDNIVIVSLDGGSTSAFSLDAGDQVSLDLKPQGRHIPISSVVQAKYLTSAPTTGAVRINGYY